MRRFGAHAQCPTRSKALDSKPLCLTAELEARVESIAERIRHHLDEVEARLLQELRNTVVIDGVSNVLNMLAIHARVEFVT